MTIFLICLFSFHCKLLKIFLDLDCCLIKQGVNCAVFLASKVSVRHFLHISQTDTHISLVSISPFLLAAINKLPALTQVCLLDNINQFFSPIKKTFLIYVDAGLWETVTSLLAMINKKTSYSQVNT